MDDSTEKNIGDREALRFHSRGKPGKLEINLQNNQAYLVP